MRRSTWQLNFMISFKALWNDFSSQALPKIFHITNLKVLFPSRVCFWPCGFVNMFDLVKSSGFSTQNFVIWLCQVCSGQYEMTGIIKAPYFMTFKKTFSLLVEKGKVHARLPFCPNSVEKLLDSEDLSSTLCKLWSHDQLWM